MVLNCPKNSGFTLIEVAIVMGLVSVITTAGVIFSMPTYIKNFCRSERDTIAALLYKVRNRSINSPNGNSSGIHFGENEYVLFYGNSYNPKDSKNEVFLKTSSAPVSSYENIIFDSFTANVDQMVVGNIVIGDQNYGCQQAISINHEGGINW